MKPIRVLALLTLALIFGLLIRGDAVAQYGAGAYLNGLDMGWGQGHAGVFPDPGGLYGDALDGFWAGYPDGAEDRLGPPDTGYPDTDGE